MVSDAPGVPREVPPDVRECQVRVTRLGDGPADGHSDLPAALAVLATAEHGLHHKAGPAPWLRQIGRGGPSSYTGSAAAVRARPGWCEDRRFAHHEPSQASFT